MEIKEKSGDLSKVEIYQLIKSPNTQKMSSVPNDEVLEYSGKYLIYEDTNKKDDSVMTVLSIMTDRGCYATNSETFRRDFLEILDIMDGESFAFTVYRGVTKAGRDFITCALYA